MRCRSCGQIVKWARFESGKTAPFEEDANGKWVIDIDVAGPLARPFVAGYDTGEDRWTSHFATCKDADAWRRE